MKRLVVIGLACLLSACQSGFADLLPGQPEKTTDYPTMGADLSDCVYRAAQGMRSPYLFRRKASTNNLEFLVTATGSNAVKPSMLPKLELRFITQGEATTVEMRDTAIGDHELSQDIWSIVDRCAQQVAKPSAAKPIAP
jgi:hypothetical protein